MSYQVFERGKPYPTKAVPLLVSGARPSVRKVVWGSVRAAGDYAQSGRASRSAAIQKGRYTQKGMGIMARPMGRPMPEIKSYDQTVTCGFGIVPYATIAGVNNSLTTGLTCLNTSLVQNAQFYGRIGTRITIKSIQLRLILHYVNTNIVPQTVRMMLLYDRQTNGAWPLIGDILGANDAGGTFLSGIQMQNRSRWLMLRDRFMTLSLSDQSGYCLNEFVQGRYDVEYGTSTGNIGDIKSGAIIIVLFFDNTAVTSPYVDSCVCRIRYFD